MKDWTAYSQTRASASNAAVRPPKVWEYALIKMVDNLFLVSIWMLIILFSAAGVWLAAKNVTQVSDRLFDFAKICLGVFLGVYTQRGRSGRT